MDFSQFKTEFNLTLDPQQEAAVQTVEGPVLLLAVPGSGKTTVLVSRLGYMIREKHIPPRQILTMTYTVAAARDMKERYESFFGPEDRLEFRTINGVCARIIRYYERTMNRTAFRLLEEGGQKSALLGELCRNQSREFATESTIKAVQTAITYVKNQMLSGEELKKVEVDGVDFPALYQTYCKTLRERQLMDFDDQMVYALQILKQYPKILQAVQNRYRYFCVDEAQDTSKIQHIIIRLLAGASGNLFMVGDEDQSIYGFRAAYPQALTEFEQVYPGAKVLYMEQNYRSTTQIVEAADRFIQKNKNRHPKHMKATWGPGPEVQEISVYDRQKQYQYLCKLAKNCTEQTAVLYRDNDSVLPLIDLLDRAGLPYRCRQVESIFFTHRIVRDITDIIRFARDPYDGERFLNIYYKMGAGISRTAAQEAAMRAEGEGMTILEYIAVRGAVSPWCRKQCRALQTHMTNLLNERADRAIYRILNFMGYGDYLDERGADRNKAEILEVLGAEESTPENLLDRLEELRQVVQQGSAAGYECPFILSTVHSSKGLEYDRVILMDVTDGILPNTLPDAHSTQEELDTYEEERRLFYVGMTRAKRQLTLITFKKPGMRSLFARELFPQKEEKKTLRPLVLPNPKKKAAVQRQAVSAAGDFTSGVRVVHKSFGPGQITVHTGDIVSIAFDSGEDKRLSLATALKMGQLKLEK